LKLRRPRSRAIRFKQMNVFRVFRRIFISYNFAGRRAGDSFALVTSNQKAKEILNWQPTKTLSDILIDAQEELLANN